MLVNARHKHYAKLRPRWAMIRDAVEGEFAIKDGGTAYLPKLHKQSETEYEAYKTRAMFFEATRRTLQGLSGMVMRKDPVIKASEKTKDGFLKHVTKEAMSLVNFSSVILQEVLMMNKYGILADLPPVISSTADPWLVGYTAESIINWDYEVNKDGKRILTRVVLEEEYELVDPEDRFKQECKSQWLVLELVAKDVANSDIENMDNPPTVIFDPSQQNVYRVQVWRRKKDLPGSSGAGIGDDEFMLHEQSFPTLRGKAMDAIPFVIVTGGDADEEYQKPPLEGLASTNMSHYRTSADLEHGRHFTALPTPYIIGLTEQVELVIGSSQAWVITGETRQNVEVGMLEFKGEGLGALERAMEEKQSQMAILGARLLEEQKKSVEAFQTHELRSAGEHSVLASIANGVSDGLNEALALLQGWDGSLGEMTIQLNTEFVRVGMTPEMLKQLVSALQAGKISFHTYFFRMQQGGMYPDEHTEEDELAAIEEDAAHFDTPPDNLDTLPGQDPNNPGQQLPPGQQQQPAPGQQQQPAPGQQQQGSQ